jgi:hypothetical protein
MTLVAIDALAVREWVAELVAGGLPAKRARKAHQVLSQILASAVDGGRLPRNVGRGHQAPEGAAQGDALPGRLEDARAEALATLARTQRGPAVVPFREGAGQ